RAASARSEARPRHLSATSSEIASSLIFNDAAVLPFATHWLTDPRIRKECFHKTHGEERAIRLQRLTQTRLMAQRVSRFYVQSIVDHNKPTRPPDQIILSAWPKISHHRRSSRQRRVRQRSIKPRVEKRKRQHAVRREHPPQRAHRLDHLPQIDVSKNRKREDDVELHAAIRNRQIANAV